MGTLSPGQPIWYYVKYKLTPQVWHAAIVVAIILHYRATFVAHSSRFEYSCARADAGQEVGEAWDDMWAYVWKTVRAS